MGSDPWHFDWLWFDQVYDVARVAPLVVYQHTTFTELEFCVVLGLESKVPEVRLVFEVGGSQCLD